MDVSNTLAAQYSNYGYPLIVGTHASVQGRVSGHGLDLLRLGDEPIVRFAETVIGTHIEERTSHVEREQGLAGQMVEKHRETTLSKEADFKDDFTKFEPGEAVIARQGEGHVYGRISLLD